MTNKQSSRDKILMGVLALVVVAAAWYMLFLTPTKSTIADLETKRGEYEAADKQVKLDLDKLSDRAVKHRIIKEEDKQKSNKDLKKILKDKNVEQDDSYKKIADFPNAANLQRELDKIFEGNNSNLNVTNENPKPGPNCQRRDISITFKAEGMTAELARIRAEMVINDLNNMPNGCLINDVTYTVNDAEGGATANVSIKISVFEFDENSTVGEEADAAAEAPAA